MLSTGIKINDLADLDQMLHDVLSGVHQNEWSYTHILSVIKRLFSF